MYHIRKYNVVCERVATYKVNDKGGTPETIAHITRDLMGLSKAIQEHFIIIALDTKLQITGVHDLYTGTVNECQVHPREVFTALLATPKTTAFAMVHNHPTGDCCPSKADAALTKRIKDCAQLMGYNLIDHIIVTDINYYSFAENGQL